MPERWFRFAPIVFVMLWSSGYSVAVVGLRDAGALTFLSLRYVFVLVILLPILLLIRPAWPRGRAWWHLAFVGATVQFGYFALSWTSLADGVGVGVAALVAGVQPILTAILAPLSGGPRPGRRLWAGLALGCAGAALVVVARLGVAAPAPIAFVFALGSMVSMTAGSLYEKRFGAGVHPMMAAGVQYAVGLVCTALLALGTEPIHVRWTLPLALSLAYLVIANSLVSITLLMSMIARGEVARVSALFFLVPPVAALAGWALTGEGLPALAWAGMAVAVVGVVLATRRAA